MLHLLSRAVSEMMALTLIGAPSAAAVTVPRPDSSTQWWFASWAIERQVWPLTKGGGVTVAVIDSGVNAKLPDLRGVVLPGADFNGTGTDGRRDVDEEFGHGTAMAALIAGQGRGTGLVGIAPQAKILPIIARGLGEDTLVPAIRFAVDHGAHIINISQAATVPPGRECPPAVQQVVAHAASKNVIVVAGAGNTGDTHNVANYPASCPGVVGVGAIDRRGAPWTRTQRQPYVTVAAPGSGITALGKDGRAWPNGSGTSHATALASGAFALLRSRFPAMPSRRLVQLVINTAVDLGPPGKDDVTGFGGVSIRRALRRQVPVTAPNPVYERLDNTMSAMSAPAASNSPTTGSAAIGSRAADSSGGAPLLGIGLAGAALAAIVVGGTLFTRRRRRALYRQRQQKPC